MLKRFVFVGLVLAAGVVYEQPRSAAARQSIDFARHATDAWNADHWSVAQLCS